MAITKGDLRCPHCQHTGGSDVRETRTINSAWIRRRRICHSCGQRWTTYESSASPWTRRQVQAVAVALRTLAGRIELESGGEE